MKKTQIYFATNRKHEGRDRWNPKGYGKKFSSDGHENLRFGQVAVEYDESVVNEFLSKKFKGNRVGDGEKMSAKLSKMVKRNSTIKVYKDFSTEKQVDFENNSSTQFFRDIKNHMMGGNDVVLFMHGYAVDWEDAVASAMSLEFMLNSKRGNGSKEVKVILFSWPSNGSNMPFAAYKSDRSDARDSAKSVGRGILKLRDFLSTLKRHTDNEAEKVCNSKIHLLCHSMGNYVLENALAYKVLGYSGGTLPRIFDQIFLCAPDVRDDAMEKSALSRLHEMGNRVSIYYNDGDVAMHFSEYTKHFGDRLGHTGNARPAMIHNKVHQIDCTPIVKGFTEHSYYQWATVNEDIMQSIQGVPLDDDSRMRRRRAQSREWEMF